MNWCYILHFETKLKQAGHYVGFTTDIDKRLKLHFNKRGARLIQVAINNGIKIKLVTIIPDTDQAHIERYLKAIRNTSRFCPICSQRKQLTDWKKPYQQAMKFFNLALNLPEILVQEELQRLQKKFN